MINNIINIKSDTLEFIENENNEKFKARTVSLSNLIQAQKLGCRLVKVDPGYRAWPFHSHRVNEEMFFVLSGQGIIRIGEQSFPIKEGDIIAAPASGPEGAHQIINNSDQEITYLCVSTMVQPDIMEYPDSDKFGVFVGAAPGASGEKRTFTFFGRKSAGVDYWEDE